MPVEDLFDAAGTLSAAYRRGDWAAGPLGSPSSWSPTLRTVLGVAFRTRFPVTLFWGPRQVLLYNEAYAGLIGDKHPAALGAPAGDVFPEIWDTIGPMLAEVARTGRANLVRDLRLLMDRHGFLEECFFTFSYSAVPGPDGTVEGVMDIAAETTPQMQSQRRLALLATLTDRLTGLDDDAEILERALEVLRGDPLDLPEVVVVPRGEDRLPGGDEVVIQAVDDNPAVHFRPAGAAGGPVLVARLSPYVVVDEGCRRFLRLIGAALSRAFERARKRETERRVIVLERDLSDALQRGR